MFRFSLEYPDLAPLACPPISCYDLGWYAPVAQLDRAFACGARGRTFESYRVYHGAVTQTLDPKIYLL